MKKVYEKPTLYSLNDKNVYDTTHGSDECENPGGSAGGECRNGPSASEKCGPGTSGPEG